MATATTPTIADAIKYLKKEVGKALEFDTKREAISTGSLSLDRVIGIGGFPRGRISEVYGWESSGKTTLCLSACAQAQRKGLFVAYIDPERGVDLMHAKRLGFNFEDETKGLYATPFSMEESFIIINQLAETGACILIVVDSVPAMVPEKELKGDIEESAGGIGLKSRLLASFLARITKTIDETNTALVFCNQMRARIAIDKFDFGPKEQAAGGSALKFYTSLRVDLRRGKQLREKVDDEEVTIGNVHHAEVVKNKVAMPWRECEFVIKFDRVRGFYGIDNLHTVIDLAKSSGIITSKGAGFFTLDINGTQTSLRGQSELYDFFTNKENLDVYKAVRAKLGV